MADNGNLLKGNPRTEFKKSSRKAAEAGRKGGIRSGESKRAKKAHELEKREFAELAKEILSYTPKMTNELRVNLERMGADPNAGNYTTKALAMVAIINKAMRGDVRAYEKVLEIIGEDPRTKIEQDRLALELENSNHVAGFSALDEAIESMVAGDAK